MVLSPSKEKKWFPGTEISRLQNKSFVVLKCIFTCDVFKVKCEYEVVAGRENVYMHYTWVTVTVSNNIL